MRLRSLFLHNWSLVLVAAITIYACLLRLDAYVAKYGTLTDPALARVATTVLAPLGARLRPYDRGWPPEHHPYVGGDPINYIRYAREMTSFYQAHVREPVFLALTRSYLWLFDGHDGAVSFASATGSVLAVLGTYLLAIMLMPRLAALAAALLMAVDYEVITWAVDGWRDDVVMASVVWTVWAYLRVRERPSVANSVLAGVCAAAACLTRITALIFVVPAFVWLLVDGPREARRARLKAAAVALAVLTLLTAPYLVSCALATGDPFYALNYHTVYYRHADSMPTDGDMSAAAYLRAKFAQHPIRTFDVGFTGLFVYPFANKWGGLQPLMGAAHRALAWLSAAGLLMLLWNPGGRLLLVVLFTSLLPYAFTWNVGDGGAWRFTMHAYPLYLVAACHALTRAIELSVLLAGDRRSAVLLSRRTIIAAAVLLLTVLGAARAYAALPWLVVREALSNGEDVNLETGGRDDIFFSKGWSKPHWEIITVRISDGDRAQVRVPLPRVGSYEVALRVDPVLPDMEQRLSVLFNGHFVARFSLTFDPQRVGSYRFRVQPSQVRPGANHIVLVPEKLVPASSAGPRFEWLTPDARIAVRLWYVRILPLWHRRDA